MAQTGENGNEIPSEVPADVLTAEQAMMERVKEVSQSIVARVREVTGDTVADVALPSDGTDEVPPVA